MDSTGGRWTTSSPPADGGRSMPPTPRFRPAGRDRRVPRRPSRDRPGLRRPGRLAARLRSPTGWPGAPADEGSPRSGPDHRAPPSRAPVRPDRRGGPQRGAPGHHRPGQVNVVAAAGPADHERPQGDLHHLAGAVLRRAGPAGADPQPVEPRHRQLDRSATPCPSATTSGGSSASGWSAGSPATSRGCSSSRRPTTSSSTSATSSTST